MKVKGLCTKVHSSSPIILTVPKIAMYSINTPRTIRIHLQILHNVLNDTRRLAPVWLVHRAPASPPRR